MKKNSLSVIIPCLNEEETLGLCLKKAKNSLKKYKIPGEIIVVDNGSKDSSVKIAKKFGAKVFVESKNKGYGCALRAGIKKAKGDFILMADADNSYDFSIINKFYKKLIEGYDFVQGCRFPIGGGVIKKNAMPISHKIFGNPFFSLLLKIFFQSPFNDVYCGMRAFKRNIALKHSYICDGMQFALENLIKFLLTTKNVTEIPITLHKDGRTKHRGHLNTVSDGVKTLKLILIFSPNWIYAFLSLFLTFIFQEDLNYFFSNFKNNTFFDISNLVLLYLILLIQIFFFWVYSKLVTINLGFSKENEFLNIFFKVFKIEYLLLLMLVYFIMILANILTLQNHIFNLIFCIIFFNSLMISMTELEKKKKF